MAGALGIRLVGKASDHGTLEPMHKCRGEKKALETIFDEMMNKMGYKGGKVRIGHSLNENAANTLKSMILKQYPNADISIIDHAGLCCFYAEKGGVLMGFEGSQKF
jgi:fatty acid-binding protein DegV